MIVGCVAYRDVEERQFLGRRAGLIASELLGGNSANRALRKVVPAMLLALREDRDSRLREGAAASLGRLSTKPQKEEYRLVIDIRDGLVAALRTDRSAAVRQQAAMSLGQQDPKNRPDFKLVHDLAGNLDVLVKGVKDPNPGVSNACAETIRRMGKDAANAAADLATLLKDKNLDPLTRTSLANVLGRIASTEALPAMKEVLADSNAHLDLRRAICDAVGDFGSNATDLIPLLANILTAKESEVELRRAAAGALDHLGSDSRSALPSLKKGMKDEDKFVRCLCLHAVGQMGKELGAETKDTIAVLLSGLNDPTLEVRVAVLETFGNLGKDGLGDEANAVIERVTALTKDGLKEIREAAENTLRKLKGP
jgi:HEAT repeat protein